MPSTHWDPDFLEEVQAEESPLDPAYPLKGKPLGPARIAGRLVRYALEGPKRLAQIWDRAKAGQATYEDSLEATMAMFNPRFGPGLGAGPAAPWRSRTLEYISNNPKVPESVSPLTWISKLKSAGLPKDEVEAVSSILSEVDPKSKFHRDSLVQIARARSLPDLGVTKTELGGPEWYAAKNRIKTLNAKQKELGNWLDRRRALYREQENIDFDRDAHDQLITKDRKYTDEYNKYMEVLAENRKILDSGYLDKVPRFSKYNIKEAENKREVLYHAKPKSGEPEYLNADMEQHYGQDKGKNLLFHQREAELTLPDGKKSTHISEQQSDWHAEYAKNSGNSLEVRQYEDLVSRDPEILNDPGIRGALDRHGFFTIGPKTFRPKNNVPEPPMKDTWYKMGFKDAVKRAVEAGHDYVTWDTADTQIKRWPAGESTEKYFKQHYDERLVKLAAKEYGVKPEKLKLPKSTGRYFVQDGGMPGAEEYHIPLHQLRVHRTEDGMFEIQQQLDNHDRPVWEDIGELRHETAESAWQFIDRNAKGGNEEVWSIPITEEMKRRVLLEGQYFSKTAKPGGRDAESVA